MLNHFTFNGHSTGELGLLVSGINIYGSPSRIVEKVTIPYRSGDLIIDTGAYTNYMLTYTVDIMDNTKATAEAISKWLLGSKGYCELTDTYNPEIYRVASYYNQLDYTLSALYRYGKATITFDCKPQKYLTANQPVSLSSTLSEETSYSLSTPAMPLPLTLEGNTTQAGSSGKNKLGLANGTYSSNGITAVVNNGVVTVSGSTGSSNVSVIDIPIATLSSSLGTVTKSLNPTGTYTGLQTSVRDSSGNHVGLWSTDASNATASLRGDGTYFRIQVNTDITINCTIKPQIEVGSTATAYEPCLSPLTPQEIHSVKGDNEVRVVGFNLWDEVTANGYYGANGVFVANASYIAGKNKIPLLPSTQYCITSLSGNLGRICFYNADGSFNSTIVNYVGATVTKYTFTTNADVYFMAFDMRSGYGTTYANDICINVSDTEKNGTYEPYKAQVYPINLPVENLLDINDYSFIHSTMSVANNSIIISSLDGSASSRIYFSRTFASGDYTISLICPNDIAPRIWSDKAFSGGTFNSYYNGWFKDFTNYTSVTLAEGSKVGLIFTGTAGVQATITNIQLERGTHANTYNPYGSPYIELNALGNYKDYFYKSDGKWYLHKATTSLLFNGTEDWRMWSASQTDVERFYITDNNSKFNNYTLCDKFYFASGTTNYEHFYFSAGGSVSQNQFTVYINKSRLSTVDATGFKAWLAQNNLRVVTELRTPTETEITDTTLISQLNALSKAKTYDGSTTIMQEGTDAQFKLSMPVPAEVTSEYKGEPIITVNEVGTIVWNDSLIKVNSAPVTINSQTLQCYYYSENKNNDVEINEFPKYEQGENYIGSTMALTVVPNYWKL